eukprot:scaffold3602_cov147-Skeletonema_menzelii.AAC.9
MERDSPTRDKFLMSDATDHVPKYLSPETHTFIYLGTSFSFGKQRPTGLSAVLVLCTSAHR